MINTCILILIVILLIYFIYYISKNNYSTMCTYGNDSLDPVVWGSSCWLFLHSAAFAYPETPTDNDKDTMKSFIKNLSCVIPCNVCKEHLKENLKKLPIKEGLQSRKNFI